MANKSVSYTEARANLAALWDRAVDDCEPVVLHRRGKEDVALISASELASLNETAYLFGSPRNAIRLTASIERALQGKGQSVDLVTLRREVSGEQGE